MLQCYQISVKAKSAKYVLSYSKPFGLLPKTLPHSENFLSREMVHLNNSYSSIKKYFSTFAKTN